MVQAKTTGDFEEIDMQLYVIITLILVAGFLYSVKVFKKSYDAGNLLVAVERAAKKALRISFLGGIVAGLSCLALSMFPIFRELGFDILSVHFVNLIRWLLQTCFATSSVYSALQIFVGVVLIIVEFCLLFSLFGFVITKRPIELRFTDLRSVEYIEEKKVYVERSLPRAFGKIFLHFANLRI